MLTPAQCRTYRLPRIPIKETESRAALFESRFGAGAVELDALEALYPGELAAIVTREIERYIDPDAARDFDAAAGEYQEYLRRCSRQVQDHYAAEVDPLREEYLDIVARLDGWKVRAAPVFDKIEKALWSDYLIEEFEPPEPKEPDDPREPLFDSSRDYLSQLAAYKGWQEGFEAPDGDEAAE